MQRRALQPVSWLARRMFATTKPSPSAIKQHTPKTEYPGFQPLIREHTQSKIRTYEEPTTHLKFLVEESGFPGCTDMGICINLGTRDEDATTAGSLNYLKNYVHIKETLDEIVRYYDFYQQSGSFFNLDYDHSFTYIKCSFFPEDVDLMLDMLLDLALKEKRMFEVLQEATQENSVMNSEVKDIVELTRRTAYGQEGLGMPKSGVGNKLSTSDFLRFQQKITPHNTLFSFANYPDPDKLIGLISKKVATKYPECTVVSYEVLRRAKPTRTKSTYRGGVGTYVNPEAEFFEFALAYQSVSLNSEHFEMMHILRTVLGTASAFSSGGPGKGMHSRCTKNLLNLVPCVEKTSAICEHYSDSGLFGLTVGGPPQLSKEVVNCTIKEFKGLITLISEEELERAKNILVASIYANIQRQADRLEEMSKHYFSYGRVRLLEFQDKIRQVTARNIQEFLRQMIRRPPTTIALTPEPLKQPLEGWLTSLPHP